MFIDILLYQASYLIFLCKRKNMKYVKMDILKIDIFCIFNTKQKN